MLVKVVLVFLVLMVVVGWVGRLLTKPGGLLGSLRRPPDLPRAAACRACGRPRIGPSPCPCGAA